MAEKEMHEFKLPHSVTIAASDDLLNKIIVEKSSNDNIQLDASEVETIDTAGIQLICSLHKDEISELNLSSKVKETIAGLGILSV